MKIDNVKINLSIEKNLEKNINSSKNFDLISISLSVIIFNKGYRTYCKYF